MNITILTPHYKSEDFLAGCLKSVADQASDLHKLGISLHHHIQDGKSKGYPGRCDRCSVFWINAFLTGFIAPGFRETQIVLLDELY